MAKNTKVKGYGAYWKGDIKNKTIARKNKQYISDQRCLRVYKKQLKELDRSEADYVNTVTKRKQIPGESSADVNATSIAEQHVEIIKPQVETVYLLQRGNDYGAHPDAQNREQDLEHKLKSGCSTIAKDSIDLDNKPRKGKHFKSSVVEEVEGNDEYNGDAEPIESDTNGEVHDMCSAGSVDISETGGNTENCGRGAEDTGMFKGEIKYKHETGSKGETQRSQKGKFSGVYAKALKLREERAKIRAQQHNERLEKLKEKKRAIREKKQDRYERHRLLGRKTKKGQPIMSSVLSHLMKNFQKKHELS
ncbi:thyroid transcription factor 1-associated protein 26, putative [Babesia ovis]|uniref:Thyroid transcription factor 1-associated protein 26, putative n=1 Tax=Babesia ovis TaxID=5869 RepID=A0A9W5T8M5_BABOV|nr:thyroid transcription factor 1-associated protein 26, putative [Babesia ovis]